jgi:hypothetical protein
MGKLMDKGISWIGRTWRRLINFLGVLLILVGVALVGFQIVVYLKDGHWERMPLFYLAALLGPDQFKSWLRHPTSWLGLHTVVDGFLKIMPLTLFLILVGWAMTVYGTKKQIT